MLSKSISRLAITAGEPAGIGADLCVQIAQKQHTCEIVIIADPELLQQRAAQLKLPLTIKIFDPLAEAQIQAIGFITVFPVRLKVPVVCGELNKNNSAYVLETIRVATQGCMDGLFAAMVTAPVHKAVINDAKFKFQGHTEYIAKIARGFPVMMLVTEKLRVALVTTHLPLKDVSKTITKKVLSKVVKTLERDLRQRFLIEKPQIVVCGLNPHAGESGHLGTEEQKIIIPVLNKLRDEGLAITGPLPADSLFTPKYLDSADAVLAMYHDQGLPVLKYQGFGEAVNITLGLSIIRTSVDHGTALELAGTGKANTGSLLLALDTALSMATNTSMRL